MISHCQRKSKSNISDKNAVWFLRFSSKFGTSYAYSKIKIRGYRLLVSLYYHIDNLMMYYVSSFRGFLRSQKTLIKYIYITKNSLSILNTYVKITSSGLYFNLHTYLLKLCRVRCQNVHLELTLYLLAVCITIQSYTEYNNII